MKQTDDIYKCSPRQVTKFVERCMIKRLVPMIEGHPGIGKSSIVNQLANKYNLQLIDVRLSTCDPTDLQGLPNFNKNGEAYFAPFNTFPLESTPIPKGKDGFLLFLDEFNSCSRAVAVAAYKLVLDRKIGMYNLHPNTAIVCAGNLTTDKAIVNTMGTAMQSRLVHIEMEVDFNEWLEDVALPQKWDSRIIAFLNNFPNKLMDFDPDSQEKTFCCPRTWEFVNKLIKGEGIDEDLISLLAGTITSGVAAEFINYTKVFDQLPSISSILLSPDTTDIPTDTSVKWAVTSILLEHIEEKNLKAFCTYMNRFDLGFRILFIRALIAQNAKYQNNKDVLDMITQNARYLYE
jgi:hypothetical protein